MNKFHVLGEQQVNDNKLKQLLKEGSFGRLYAHAMLAVTPDSPESRKTTEGSWTKYSQTDDPRVARRLSGSLQGHGTGWCTAGESTATMQLRGGDFYVYYSRDADGKDTVPRVAIRMQNGEVAEVRGVQAAQELEPVMADVTGEKLQDLPGGEAYVRKAEDMKRLTAIEKKISTNNQAELTIDELRFLYELDHHIEGFGYERDPRIDSIISRRNTRNDYAFIFHTSIENIAGPDNPVSDTTVAVYGGATIDKLIVRGGNIPHSLTHVDRITGYHGKGHLNVEIADKLLALGHMDAVLNSLPSFRGLRESHLYELIRYGGFDAPWVVLRSIESFTNIDVQKLTREFSKLGEAYEKYTSVLPITNPRVFRNRSNTDRTLDKVLDPDSGTPDADLKRALLFAALADNTLASSTRSKILTKTFQSENSSLVYSLLEQTNYDRKWLLPAAKAGYGRGYGSVLAYAIKADKVDKGVALELAPYLEKDGIENFCDFAKRAKIPKAEVEEFAGSLLANKEATKALGLFLGMDWEVSRTLKSELVSLIETGKYSDIQEVVRQFQYKLVRYDPNGDRKFLWDLLSSTGLSDQEKLRDYRSL